MQVTLVVAASTNNVIGKQGKLPWRLPEDLRRFRQLTMGKPIVMGRRTYDSIGRPLPGRRNIVISRQRGLKIEGCEVAQSPDEALSLAVEADEVMIVGGSHVYEAFLPLTERIHMTRVHASIEGNAFFPELRPEAWQIVWTDEYPVTNERPVAFTFETLSRRLPPHL